MNKRKDDNILAGDLFLCTQDVIMNYGELAYKKGKIYQSEMNGCITDESKIKEHYWTGDAKWTSVFTRWINHKRKNKKYTLHESWFSKSNELFTEETWETALNFEKIWLKNYTLDPKWWNVSSSGNIILELEVEDGKICIVFEGHRIRFYTGFKGVDNYSSKKFDWYKGQDLLSENLKILLKKYE